jgi:hypothetical protein
MPLYNHAQGIADEDNLYTALLDEACETVVIGGQTCELFSLLF